jgi:hypothetical protein
MALPVMVRRGIFAYTLRNFGMNLADRYGAGRADVAVGANSLGGRVPYSLCILIGAVGALWHVGLRW